MWKELRKLGLLPKTQTRVEHHGFTPEESNSHFPGVSVSTEECEDDLNKVMAPASDEGYTFNKVTFSVVVLAVAHFSSQAKSEDSIP